MMDIDEGPPMIVSEPVPPACVLALSNAPGMPSYTYVTADSDH